MECCVCFYGFKGSITCCCCAHWRRCSRARPGAFLYTYMDLFSASAAEGWKRPKVCARPAAALFSPLLGKGVDWFRRSNATMQFYGRRAASSLLLPAVQPASEMDGWMFTFFSSKQSRVSRLLALLPILRTTYSFLYLCVSLIQQETQCDHATLKKRWPVPMRFEWAPVFVNERPRRLKIPSERWQKKLTWTQTSCCEKQRSKVRVTFLTLYGKVKR